MKTDVNKIRTYFYSHLTGVGLLTKICLIVSQTIPSDIKIVDMKL